MPGSNKEIVSALQAQSAFKDCSKRDLEELAKHADRSSVPSHWSFIQQQTPADACYVILEGEADVMVEGKKVATIGPGGVVGEAGLVGHKLRNATVTSRTKIDLLHISADQFAEIIDERPALKDVLLARTQPAADAAAEA